MVILDENTLNTTNGNANGHHDIDDLSQPIPPQHPWIVTPLIESKSLSEVAGCRVLLKLELLQPSGSFKSRGVGNLILKAISSLPPNAPPSSVHIYSSSGGNAGLAAVVAAKSLGCPCTVAVPETTTQLMIRKIKAAGGRVLQVGESWQEADLYLRELMVTEQKEREREGRLGKGVYCPPFDHPDIWEGNSTMIDEIITQIPPGTPFPSAILTSVGGGGLLIGIQQGLERNNLSDTPLLAIETRGAASLAHALNMNDNNTTPLSKITSIATSLGARKVADECYRVSLPASLGSKGNVTSIVMDDWQAAQACIRFAEEQRCIVEAACGVSLAVCYFGELQKVMKEVRGRGLARNETVVVVVCGGSNISLEMLNEYRRTYGEMQDELN